MTQVDNFSFRETHSFIVHYLNEQKKLKNLTFNSVDEITKKAFACFDQYHFNENNAILTYFDSYETLTLLTTIPSPLEDGQARNLYIKYVSVRISLSHSILNFSILQGFSNLLYVQ